MKSFIITTKNLKGEYEKIKNYWFGTPSTIEEEIESTITIVQTPESDQSIYNNILIRQEGNYRFFLPEVVDPNLSHHQRSDYVLDVLCVIAEKYKIDKKDLYFIVHSRDLFSLEDFRSGYGFVFNRSLSCSPIVRNRVSQYIEDGHIFQFHHTSNEIANLLLYPQKGDTISTLGKAFEEILLAEEKKLFN